MGSSKGNGISSNFSVSGGGSSSEEVLTFAILLDGDFANDVCDIAGQTPIDLLMEKEETDEAAKDMLDTRKQVVSSLLSFLFKPVRGMLPSPAETCIRLWLLCYLTKGNLINGMSLSEIGRILGESFDTPALSRQTLSARLRKLNSSLNIRARTQKSQSSVEVYSALGKERWADKKEQERQEKRRAYMQEYRDKNREKKRLNDQLYYQANRKRILEARRKKRKITL